MNFSPAAIVRMAFRNSSSSAVLRRAPVAPASSAWAMLSDVVAFTDPQFGFNMREAFVGEGVAAAFGKSVQIPVMVILQPGCNRSSAAGVELASTQIDNPPSSSQNRPLSLRVVGRSRTRPVVRTVRPLNLELILARPSSSESKEEVLTRWGFLGRRSRWFARVFR